MLRVLVATAFAEPRLFQTGYFRTPLRPEGFLGLSVAPLQRPAFRAAEAEIPATALAALLQGGVVLVAAIAVLSRGKLAERTPPGVRVRCQRHAPIAARRDPSSSRYEACAGRGVSPPPRTRRPQPAALLPV